MQEPKLQEKYDCLAENKLIVDILRARFFVSYRREDGGTAGRLSDSLKHEFGRDYVFFEVEKLQPGQDYTVVLPNAIVQCDVVIAVVGKKWNRSIRRDGWTMDDPNDWVRIEFIAALKNRKCIIPCLVDGASRPQCHHLPAVLARVANLQVVEISHARFEHDIARLAEALKKIELRAAVDPGLVGSECLY